MKEKDTDIFEQTKKFNTGIKLYMFQTGSIKTKLKFIKMNQTEEPYEIPVPWFLIKHPEGDVVIDGGMPIEAALDKHKHWGSVVEAYDPVMKPSEWCKDVVKTVNTKPEDVKYVIQTHLIWPRLQTHQPLVFEFLACVTYTLPNRKIHP